MNKYPGTYLSLLPPDLIRKLDEIEGYINRNEEFNKLGQNITEMLNRYYQRTDYYAVQLLINELNGFFIDYNIISRFTRIGSQVGGKIVFDNNSYQNISDKFLNKFKSKIESIENETGYSIKK